MAAMEGPSRNSSSEGLTPDDMICMAASRAGGTASKRATIVSASSGAGRSDKVACVITPSVPSEPTSSLVSS